MVGGAVTPSTVKCNVGIGFVNQKFGRIQKMSKVVESQIQHSTITQIAKSRDIPRDRVVHIIRTRNIPHDTMIGNTRVYSPAQREAIESELTRTETSRQGGQ